MSDDRWLVVGLGNPEAEYSGTRHNIGREVLDLLAERHHASLSRNKKVGADVDEVRVGSDRIVLVRPGGYMNNSGGPVQQTAAWYKVPPERIVVVYDEIDLEVGDLRVKQGGGNNGHNGLKDLDQRLASTDYFRVRVGVGRPPGRMPVKDHVLRRFNPAERETIDVVVQHAADAVEQLVAEGLAATQNRYNGPLD